MKRIFALMCILFVLMPTLALAGDAVLLEASQTLVEQIIQGDVDAYYDLFAPELQAALPREAMQAIPDQLQAQAGAFEGTGEAYAEGPVVYVPMQMALANLVAQMAYDGEGLLAGLYFKPAVQVQAAPIAQEPDEETVFVGPKQLEGFLKLPQGDGPFPAVVLVHGSGSHDRNEALGGTAVFYDLAKGLAEKGIATLRYDKRSYAIAEGKVAITQEEIENFTAYEDTVEDAIAAVKMLREDGRIDAGRVFVLGHSQGGMLAGRIQTEGADANGLIIFAGTLRYLAEVYVDQLRNMDAESSEVQAELETARALPEMTEAEAHEATLLGQSGYIWWEEMQHDYTAIAERVEVPMLILQGTEDTNVFADIDYPLWDAFAAAHPQKDITLTLYEGLGHLFVDGNNVSSQVIDDIAAWILQR